MLKGEIGWRLRDLIRQICHANDIWIIDGCLYKDHVDLYVSYPPKLSVSEIMRRIKGRSSRKIQQESPKGGQHLVQVMLQSKPFVITSDGTQITLTIVMSHTIIKQVLSFQAKLLWSQIN